MRTAFIPFALWLGVLQLPGATPSTSPTQNVVEMISAALALTGLTAAVYRLGVLREQLSNTSGNVTVELSRFRDDMTRGFDIIERRMSNLEQHIAAASEQRVVAERWQGRVDLRLEGHDRRLVLLEGAPSDIRAEAVV